MKDHTTLFMLRLSSLSADLCPRCHHGSVTKQQRRKRRIMKKKVVSLLAAMALAVTALAGCGSNDAATTGTDAATVAATTEAAGTTEAATDSEAVTGVKAGFIFLHDENSTYDLNFLNAAKAACELADAGCNFIFADSFGHEDYIIEAAKEYPNVQFSHATGTKAHTEGLDNFHNAFASIYDGRYLAGIVAGMKLNEMIANGDITEDQAKMGYVGAYTYAEVMSGYTSFFLGARSVCPSVTMDVTFTGSWYDETAEKEAANKLIEGGCVLISQHADSMGAPTACETAGVPNVSYNGSTEAACPNTFLVSSRVNWEPYFEYAIKCVADGTPIDTDWCGTLETGSVELSDLGAAVADGTAEAVEAAKADLIAGKAHVYDITTFTVDGKTLDSYEADIDTDPDYTPDHEVVSDGYFHESDVAFRSAPYFNVRIDGINLLDEQY